MQVSRCAEQIESTKWRAHPGFCAKWLSDNVRNASVSSRRSSSSRGPHFCHLWDLFHFLPTYCDARSCHICSQNRNLPGSPSRHIFGPSWRLFLFSRTYLAHSSPNNITAEDEALLKVNMYERPLCKFWLALLLHHFSLSTLFTALSYPSLPLCYFGAFC